MRISFVGCGAAGRALARLWLRAGHEIGAIRARTHAPEAVAAVGAGEANGSLEDADVVVFATPDDVLAAVAAATPLRAEQLALHLSGAHPSTVLTVTGARVASIHPLRAFASLDVDMAESWCFVEGDPAAASLAADLGARVARIATEKKALYHAGAAIGSNFLVTVAAWARRCFQEAGIDDPEPLLALMAGSLENVRAQGLPDALTGPIARGDVAVVQAHLDALPEAEKPLYRALLSATIPIGAARGTLDEEAAKQLQNLASKIDGAGP
ncbi:MAG: DUF2520 domain-containing protein [Planctomycetota bacterium]